jgi:hypothetical protein
MGCRSAPVLTTVFSATLRWWAGSTMASCSLQVGARTNALGRGSSVGFRHAALLSWSTCVQSLPSAAHTQQLRCHDIICCCCLPADWEFYATVAIRNTSLMVSCPLLCSVSITFTRTVQHKGSTTTSHLMTNCRYCSVALKKSKGCRESS